MAISQGLARVRQSSTYGLSGVNGAIGSKGDKYRRGVGGFNRRKVLAEADPRQLQGGEVSSKLEDRASSPAGRPGRHSESGGPAPHTGPESTRAEAPDGEADSGALMRLFGRRRRTVQMATDSLAWIAVVPAATWMRYDFHASRLHLGSIAFYVVVAVVLQGALGSAARLYSGRYSYGAFEEVAGLTRAVVTVTAIGVLLNQIVLPDALPRSVPFLAGFMALGVMGFARYAWRLNLERLKRPSLDTSEPVLVFGAGEGAEQLVTSMLRSPSSPYLPVALLDDDPAKRHLRLKGVPMAGDRHAIGEAAEHFGAKVLVIAIPSASATLVRELAGLASDAGLQVRVLPPVEELLGEPGVADVRPLSITDLLGRHEIDTDLLSIAEYLTERRVLVTGAGGSIGAELCRQIHAFSPASLIMVDRDESALHAVQLSITGRALLDSQDVVVADIRDESRVREVFEQHRPEVVFHAAALKHLPLLEMHPVEGVKTNVYGTLNVLCAAMEAGVERFVNISTDKAADPISMLGYTKRIAERLTSWAAGETDGTFLSVRFGNVLGSRGSVLTAFRAQIAGGGPVTVTDPDVTRYFMTVEEAVQLVIQAGAVGRDGEALVLDMGEPVSICEVADRLIAESGKDIEVVFTGLRPGEKLHEVLRSTREPDHRPCHPKISHVCVPPLDPEHVTDAPAATVAKGAHQLCDLYIDLRDHIDLRDVHARAERR